MADEKFPGWVSGLLKNPPTETHHGLNLVLELEDAVKLPLMLWDIVLAQDQIHRALEELSFVHYARFVPSYDGQALMVITEFDGDRDPYVLDFVIALGDVFDVLLGYVKRTDDFPGPVRKNPQAFARWVREHNRVPFLPTIGSAGLRFPGDYDYPVYSAYRGKTVTDIAGARKRLPPAALDHPTAVVDPADVQGNILRGYGPQHGRYLFYTVSDPQKARTWLATTLPRTETPWGGIGTEAGWPEGKTPLVLTQVAFTHEGLRTLLPGDGAALTRFPEAFREGAATRASDNGDKDKSAPDSWMFGGTDTPVHVVLFLYAKTDAGLPDLLHAVKALSEGAAVGLTWRMTMDGVRLPDPSDPERRYATEPFGFVDGLSDPPISGQRPGKEPALQPAASPGEFLLHADYTSIYGGPSLGGMPARLASNGSFGVLRLLEQDVATFRRATEEQAAKLEVDVGLLQAKLVGRWPDGTPLALSPDQPTGNKTNAFDYAPSWEYPGQRNDHDGLACPVGAHVRRSNPRTARAAGQRHSHRLLRRGMSSRWTDAGTGTECQGLMGLFMGADIERQFEFIQRQWLQRDLAASGIRGTTDPIAAIRTGDTDFHFLVSDPRCAHAPPLRKTARIPPLVRTRGCLYLFFPGLNGLRSLGGADAPAAAGAVNAANRDAAEAAVLAAEAAANAAAQRRAGPAPDAASHPVGAGIGGLLDRIRNEVDEAAKAVVDAAGDAADAAAGLARELLALPNKLEALLDVPTLKTLAGGKWQSLVQALIDGDITSEYFRPFLEALSPPRPTEPDGPVDDVHDVSQDLGFDFDNPRFRAFPFTVLKRLREQRSIVWVPAQRAYWVLSHAGCKDLLDRHGDFVQVPQTTPHRGIVTLDQHRHTAVRSAFVEAFQVAMQALERNDTIRNVVQDRLAALLAGTRQRQFDFMADYAHPVARQVVWALIGIEEPEDQAECDALADRLVMRYGKTATPGGVDALVAADAGLRLAAKLALPLSHAWLISAVPGNRYRGTLIGELAARMGLGLEPEEGDPPTFIEVLLTLVQTVLASQSPHFLLGSAAQHLLTPDNAGNTPWQALAERKGNAAEFGQAIAAALDETRRFEPPLTLVERYAKGAQTICGVTVPDGSAVFAMVASGNRDAGVFGAYAEQFQANRPIAPDDLLSLGHGIHACAGRDLQARLAPVALGAIVLAMDKLRLRNPTAFPAWQPTVYFRVLQGLSVTCCPP